MNNIFKKAMEVGYYFDMELNERDDDRVSEWTGSEDCATFAKIIVDYAEDNGCDINFAFYEIMDETVDGICDETISVSDHMWDDYCKGFLAGEILGYPTPETMEKVKEAEKLWKNDSYGYYQEVLNEVR